MTDEEILQVAKDKADRLKHRGSPFMAKRREWLAENAVHENLRDNIGSFLAAFNGLNSFFEVPHFDELSLRVLTETLRELGGDVRAGDNSYMYASFDRPSGPSE